MHQPNPFPVSVAIIGSGPAGYTAAIYTTRAGLSTILYKGMQPGGQLTTTSLVENYPGYPQGIDGNQMMLDFEEQANRFGATIVADEVTAVCFDQYPFYLTTANHGSLYAKTVIIATGATVKWLGLASEQRLNGKGVSACATCDGFFFKNQEVAVIGGGDTAAEEALYLANICSHVYLYIRGSHMKASHIMQQRIAKTTNITQLFHTQVTAIAGEEAVTGIQLYNNQTNTHYEQPVQGVFIAIGHTPNTHLFTKYLDLDAHGYIKTIPGTTSTNIPGIFAAGDVQDPIYRQAITAAGTGCMAALAAEKFLTEANLS